MGVKTAPAASAESDSWLEEYRLDNFGDASEASGGLDFTGAATGTQDLTDANGHTVEWEWRNGTQPTAFGVADGGALQITPPASAKNFWAPSATSDGGQFGVRLDRIFDSLSMHDELCVQIALNPAAGVTGSNRRLHIGAMVSDGTAGFHSRFSINESGTHDYISGYGSTYASEAWAYTPRLLEFRFRFIDEGGSVTWSTEAPGAAWPKPGRTPGANDVRRGLRRRGALNLSNALSSFALDDTYLWIGAAQNSGQAGPSMMEATGVRLLRLIDES